MLLSAEYSLCPVRMVREKGSIQSFIDLPAVLGKGHVLLLVYCLKLGMESSDYRILEPVCLYAGPVVDFV